jgi:hypothetical protein
MRQKILLRSTLHLLPKLLCPNLHFDHADCRLGRVQFSKFNRQTSPVLELVSQWSDARAPQLYVVFENAATGQVAMMFLTECFMMYKCHCRRTLSVRFVKKARIECDRASEVLSEVSLSVQDGSLRRKYRTATDCRFGCKSVTVDPSAKLTSPDIVSCAFFQPMNHGVRHLLGLRHWAPNQRARPLVDARPLGCATRRAARTTLLRCQLLSPPKICATG